MPLRELRQSSIHESSSEALRDGKGNETSWAFETGKTGLAVCPKFLVWQCCRPLTRAPVGILPGEPMWLQAATSTIALATAASAATNAVLLPPGLLPALLQVSRARV